MQILLFSLFFITVSVGFHYYIWKRLVQQPRLTSWRKTIGTIVIVTLAVSVPATIVLPRLLSPGLAKIISTVPLIWLGTLIFLISLLVLFDVFFLIRYLIQRIGNKPPPPSTAPADAGRRDSLRKIAAASALGISGSLSAISVRNCQKSPVVIRQHLFLDKLPASLNGLRIVQISDIHVGLTIDGHFLSEVVSKVNQLQPDIVAITGDLIDGYVNTLKHELSSLRQLTASHGVYFVTGNHEYYFRASEWTALLSEMGITVLNNQAVEIGNSRPPLLLAGVPDFQAGHMGEEEPNLERALAKRQKDQEVVLLCHQPKIVHEAAALDVGLILSGHTHGGQIWPFNYLVSLQQPYVKGHIQHNRRTQLYINQGTGYWGPPMRLGTVCEITCITLSRKEN